MSETDAGTGFPPLGLTSTAFFVNWETGLKTVIIFTIHLVTLWYKFFTSLNYGTFLATQWCCIAS